MRDCISRQAVIDLMMQKWGENFSGDDAMQESIDAIREMPSVTPQEPCDKCEVGNPCLYCKHDFEPTTKNDLGVDREDAVERLNALKQLIGYDKDSEIVKATQKSLDMAIKALEKNPKTGYWILTDVEGYRVWHCNCSECGKDPQDYVGGSEDWWLIRNNLPKFCPTCGSDNREVKE